MYSLINTISVSSTLHFLRRYPEPRALLTLLKPVTWFPPIWAYLCGVVSSGVLIGSAPWLVLLGIVLAGPVVCGMSQAANDWCDRHVDAINEPDRPIPSGRVPGRWGLWVALVMSALALVMGLALGPWFTGAAVLAAGAPAPEVVAVAALYAIGAHGIMTLNDFKALEGDRITGVNSLPVTLGPERAARVACVVMVMPQLAVIALLLAFGQVWHAGAIAVLVIAQGFAMRVLLSDPKRRAPWYNSTGVMAYVSGMMVAAFALRGLGGMG